MSIALKNFPAKEEAARSIILAPSLISADWWRVAEQIREVEAAGCQWLHFDAMDGQFAPNLTLGPMFLEAVRPHCQLHFDAHLMICQPENRINDFLHAGADSISVHVEGNAHLHRLIWQIKDGGSQAGAVLNPATPVEMLEVILPDLDYVLVMSVNPGFSGQKFLPSALDKIRLLAAQRAARGLDFLIQIDGGMAPETAPLAVEAGADVLVCGSAIFNAHHTPKANVAALRRAIAASL